MINVYSTYAMRVLIAMSPFFFYYRRFYSYITVTIHYET